MPYKKKKKKKKKKKEIYLINLLYIFLDSTHLLRLLFNKKIHLKTLDVWHIRMESTLQQATDHQNCWKVSWSWSCDELYSWACCHSFVNRHCLYELGRYSNMTKRNTKTYIWLSKTTVHAECYGRSQQLSRESLKAHILMISTCVVCPIKCNIYAHKQRINMQLIWYSQW